MTQLVRLYQKSLLLYLNTCEEHIIEIRFDDSGEADLRYRWDIPDTVLQEDEG